MTIRFLCPDGHPLTVSRNFVGKPVRCAGCKQIVVVPETSTREVAAQEEGSKTPDVSAQPALPKPESKPESKSTPPPLPRRKPAAKPPAKAKPVLTRPPPPAKQKPRKRRRDRKRAIGRAEASEATPSPQQKETRRKAPEKVPEQTKPAAARRKPVPRGPTLMPPDVCRPDEGRLVAVKWLALILGVVVLFSTAPVFVKMHWNLQTAPGWARLVVLMVVLQGVYIAWMLNNPDWAAVWVVMLVFAAVASIYGAATAMVIATPLDRPMLLGMEEVRHTATGWCGAVLSAMSLATYLCGRTSAKWRRAFELQTAGKGRPRR